MLSITGNTGSSYIGRLRNRATNTTIDPFQLNTEVPLGNGTSFFSGTPTAAKGQYWAEYLRGTVADIANATYIDREEYDWDGSQEVTELTIKDSITNNVTDLSPVQSVVDTIASRLTSDRTDNLDLIPTLSTFDVATDLVKIGFVGTTSVDTPADLKADVSAVATSSEVTALQSYGDNNWSTADLVSTNTAIAAIPTTPLLVSDYVAPNNGAITNIETLLGTPNNFKADLSPVQSVVDTLSGRLTSDRAAKLDTVATTATAAEYKTDTSTIGSQVATLFGLVNASGDAFTAIALANAPTGGGGGGLLPDERTKLLEIPSDPLLAGDYIAPLNSVIQALSNRATESRLAKLDVAATTDNADLFKATIPSDLSTFDPTTDTVNLGFVAGTAVSGLSDFMADTSGLATGANITALQTHGDSNWLTADLVATNSAIAAIPTNPLLNTGYTAPDNAGISTITALISGGKFTATALEDGPVANISALATQVSVDALGTPLQDSKFDALLTADELSFNSTTLQFAPTGSGGGGALTSGQADQLTAIHATLESPGVFSADSLINTPQSSGVLSPEERSHLLGIPQNPLLDDDYIAPLNSVLQALSDRAPESRLAKLDTVATTANADTFKAIIPANLSTFDPASDSVIVGTIGLTAITGPDDLKADVSGLATSAGITGLQTYGDTNWATANLSATNTAIANIPTNPLLESAYVAPDNAGIAAGQFAAESADAKLTASRLAQLDKDLSTADVSTIEPQIATLFGLVNGSGDAFTSEAMANVPTGSGGGSALLPDERTKLFEIPSNPLLVSDYTAPDNAAIQELSTRATELRLAKLDVVATTDNAEIFKANIPSGLSTFNPSADTVNIGSVAGTAVFDLDDFKTDTSLLATTENIISLQSHGDSNWTSSEVYDDSNVLSAINSSANQVLGSIQPTLSTINRNAKLGAVPVLNVVTNQETGITVCSDDEGNELLSFETFNADGQPDSINVFEQKVIRSIDKNNTLVNRNVP